MASDQAISVTPTCEHTSVSETFARPGARPQRALSRKELIRLGRSQRRVDALLMSFSAFMADKKPRPLRPVSRYNYVRKIAVAIRIAEEGGHSFLAGDARVVRFVLGSLSPHPSTQNTYLSAFRLFFEFMKKQGMRKDNPTDGIGRPPQFKHLPRPIGIDDVCEYLDAAWKLGTEHTAIACLGLYMGLRRQEITECQWSWFFQAEGRWWCDVSGKGGKTARTPVHDEVRRVLTRLRETHRDATWLFPSRVRARAGYPMSMNSIVKRHFDIIEAAGLDHYTMHQLRHSFATYLRRVKDVDQAIVQKGLRHSSSASTEVYMEILDDQLGDAIDGLDFRRIRDEIHEKRAARERKTKGVSDDEGGAAGVPAG